VATPFPDRSCMRTSGVLRRHAGCQFGAKVLRMKPVARASIRTLAPNFAGGSSERPLSRGHGRPVSASPGDQVASLPELADHASGESIKQSAPYIHACFVERRAPAGQPSRKRRASHRTLSATFLAGLVQKRIDVVRERVPQVGSKPVGAEGFSLFTAFQTVPLAPARTSGSTSSTVSFGQRIRAIPWNARWTSGRGLHQLLGAAARGLWTMRVPPACRLAV
jgi:hypothetical protein